MILFASPNHGDGSREAAAHVEREESFCVLDLASTALLRELLIRFEDLANTCRPDRVTVSDYTAACVHRNLERSFEFFGAHLRQRRGSAFHKLDTLAGFGESENFVGNNFSNGKAIVHLGALQVARR